MIVCVATDIAADRLFDYAVPPALEENVRLGCRVRVPFGGREADAYVIEIRDNSVENTGRRKPVESMELFDLPSAPPKLKSILSVDTEEHLSPKLIELSRWMANYYCAPFELALRCALPAAVRNREMRSKVGERGYRCVFPDTEAEGVAG
jgi:primosomal protein N' (replication factor Y)